MTTWKPGRSLILLGIFGLAVSSGWAMAGSEQAPASGGVDPAHAKVLPEVTVTTGTRSERARERSPSSVEVIDREQIERSGGADLGEVLRRESSLFVSPDGTQASIRGARREDNVILIDGRRVLGEPSRRYELNRIPTGSIERIEIVKGPGSVLYGADALGGVINVITRKPEPGLHGDIDVQAGARTEDAEADRYKAALGLHGGGLDTRFRVDAQATSRAAYSETATVLPEGRRGIKPDKFADYDVQERYTIDEDRRDEADVYTLAGTLEHFFTDDLQVTLQADYLHEERERDYINIGPTQVDDGNDGAVANIPARWLDDNQRLGLAAAADWQATGTLNLFFRSYRSVYEKERIVTSEPWTTLGYSAGERPKERDRDVTLTDWRQELIASWTPGRAHSVQLGAEHRDHEYEDHQLVSGSETRWDAAAFAQHEWAVTDRLDLVYGARYDDSSLDDADNTAVEGGIVYAFAPAARLRLNYAQGYSVPAARDLYADTAQPSGRRQLGAAVETSEKAPHNLDPERSESVEIGLSGSLGALGPVRESRYDLAVFHTIIEDRITRERRGEPYVSFYNLDDEARIGGSEGSLELALPAGLRVDLGVTWLDAIERGERHELPYAPEWSARAALAGEHGERFGWRARVQYTGSHVDEIDPDDQQAQEAFTQVDLQGHYRPPAWEQVRLYAGIDNVFDTSNDTSLYADPGRYARLGLRASF
ncbi:TonB-dependent receptor plug domain-containing protein [Halorhodospira halophila]|uniref:TonB-dependent receptor plug domain-containing protein n=1 Tax=Halorhodospira halophila TaxID=1053 RepID=UPI00191252FA|nr:TonB-dependent receptor [Halorhodospira halophila]MBK5944530.1 hypothetical protein [Halorhodospira halophila]